MLMANGTQLASRYFVNYGWQGSVSSWVSLADAVGYPRSSLEFGINLESPGQFTGSGQKTSFEETSKEVYLWHSTTTPKFSPMLKMLL